MNKYCYCTKPLKWDDDVPTKACRNCCRDLVPSNDKVIYTCFRKANCIYWKLNGYYYYVCGDCYHEDNNDSKNDFDQENIMKFILKKFTNSISSIS